MWSTSAVSFWGRGAGKGSWGRECGRRPAVRSVLPLPAPGAGVSPRLGMKPGHQSLSSGGDPSCPDPRFSGGGCSRVVWSQAGHGGRGAGTPAPGDVATLPRHAGGCRYDDGCAPVCQVHARGRPFSPPAPRECVAPPREGVSEETGFSRAVGSLFPSPPRPLAT